MDRPDENGRLRGARVAVLSDVHGNAVALEAVLDEVRAERPDLVVYGGDLTWGPLPQATLRLVRDFDAPTVFIRGNAERALLEPSAEPTEREQWMLQEHPPSARAFLATFVEQEVVSIDGLGPVRFCHGSPRSDEELVTPGTPPSRIQELTAGVAERVVVTAHTHLQFDRTDGGVRVVNAGSVGLPYEGRRGAFWALLGPDVSFRRTEYAVDDAAERYRASGDPLAEQMVEMLLSPPTRAEVIEDAERRVFAG